MKCVACNEAEYCDALPDVYGMECDMARGLCMNCFRAYREPKVIKGNNGDRWVCPHCGKDVTG